MDAASAALIKSSGRRLSPARGSRCSAIATTAITFPRRSLEGFRAAYFSLPAKLLRTLTGREKYP
jgi:hypothetical protein